MKPVGAPQLYAVTVSAMRAPSGGRSTFASTVFLTAAHSVAEAIGLGVACGEYKWPAALEWLHTTPAAIRIDNLNEVPVWSSGA